MNNNLFNTVNLKDLPQLEQILPGNFLVVENNAGTNKLDFADFVIGPSNTSFFTSIASNIFTLSSSVVSLSSDFEALFVSNSAFKRDVSNVIKRFPVIDVKEIAIQPTFNFVVDRVELPPGALLYNNSLIVNPDVQYPPGSLTFTFGYSGDPIYNQSNDSYTYLIYITANTFKNTETRTFNVTYFYTITG